MAKSFGGRGREPRSRGVDDGARSFLTVFKGGGDTTEEDAWVKVEDDDLDGFCDDGVVSTGANAGVCETRPRRRRRRSIGGTGENIAARFLRRRGYTILERNWRCVLGEADIIARDEEGGDVVLVEVKTRDEFGHTGTVAPELAVGDRKQAKYRQLAMMYYSYHDVTDLRFDIVAVSLKGEMAQVRHIINAFGWEME